MVVRRFLVLAALATFVAASGCSGKREQAEESRKMQTGEAQSSEPPARGGTAAEDSAESGAGLFSRIHFHESRLSQTITSGRLDEVGREAFLIRDLTVTAAGQANVPVDQKAALGSTSTVRRVATDLRGRKAGDRTRSARNAELQGSWHHRAHDWAGRRIQQAPSSALVLASIAAPTRLLRHKRWPPSRRRARIASGAMTAAARIRLTESEALLYFFLGPTTEQM
jgi:hypothetical protein